jgi:type II secretory pathway component PulM
MARTRKTGRSIFGLLSILVTLGLMAYVGVQLWGIFKGGSFGLNMEKMALDKAKEVQAKVDQHYQDVRRQIEQQQATSTPATAPTTTSAPAGHRH